MQYRFVVTEMHAAIIGEILTLAESVAVGLRNDCQDNESAVKWYECIVKMSSVQGMTYCT